MTEQGKDVGLRGPILKRARIVAMVVAWVVCGGGAVLALPGAAHAQTTLQELSWAHGSPNTVSRFVVFASTTKGNQASARQINVGKPPNPTPAGSLFVYSAIVAVNLNEYVAVAAVGLDGSISTLSRWTAVPPTTPGQPLLIP